MSEDSAILQTIGRFLQKWETRNSKKKKGVKAPVGLESKLGGPKPKMTGEDVYQRAMKLFPPEEKEQLRHSPRIRSGF
jgi:hypothetical protein